MGFSEWTIRWIKQFWTKVVVALIVIPCRRYNQSSVPYLCNFCGSTCNSFTAMVTVIYLSKGHGRDGNVWPVSSWVFILSQNHLLWGEGMDSCFPLQGWVGIRNYSSSSGTAGHKRSYVWNLCKCWGLKKGKYSLLLWVKEPWCSTREAVFSQRYPKTKGGQDGDLRVAASCMCPQVIWQDWFVRNFRVISFRNTHYVHILVVSVSTLLTSHSSFCCCPTRKIPLYQNHSPLFSDTVISDLPDQGWICSQGRILLWKHDKTQRSYVVHGTSTTCISLLVIQSVFSCCERK